MLDTGETVDKSETTFSPYDTITREQIAAILYRYSEKRSLNMLYGDVFDFSKSAAATKTIYPTMRVFLWNGTLQTV